MKIIIAIAILASLICVVAVSMDRNEENLGLTLDQKIDAFIADIDEYETLNKAEKYKQILPTYEDSIGITYQVHEYQTSSGEVGYQLIINKPDGSIISKGVGVEADARTYTIPAPAVMTSST